MLTGKNALVTGASRGIGRAIALELAKRGAFVVVNYNGSEDAANETVAAIKAAGGDAVSVRCNVSDFTACQEMIESLIKEYKHMDILVNNAGITRDDLLMRMKESDFDAVINTNLKGLSIQFVICHAIFKTACRKNYQYFFGIRNPWKCGTVKLCSQQGGRDRSDKICCKGACIQRNLRQCGSSRICRDRDDRSIAGKDPGRIKKADPAWQSRTGTGYCACSRISCITGVGLYYRTGTFRRRWYGHLRNLIERKEKENEKSRCDGNGSNHADRPECGRILERNSCRTDWIWSYHEV